MRRATHATRITLGPLLFGTGLITAGLIAAGCAQAAGEPPDTASEDWRLVFSDDFDGSALDPAKWHTCYWWDDDGCTISSNAELEWYQPDQVTVGDGVLTLRAEPRPIDASDGESYPYVSGMVSSGRDSSDVGPPPRFSFQYGFVEARVSVPDGTGLWPAIWMLPITHESKPEIDILEVYADPGVAKMRLHWLDTDGERQQAREEAEVEDLHAGFHTFGLEWTPEGLRWFIDGAEVWRTDDFVPEEPMYLLMNLAVGGNSPGPPNPSTVFPADFVVDWLRVWQPAEIVEAAT